MDKPTIGVHSLRWFLALLQEVQSASLRRGQSFDINYILLCHVVPAVSDQTTYKCLLSNRLDEIKPTNANIRTKNSPLYDVEPSLSLVWLIQKKPMNDSWLMQSSLVMYVPSMNPRGRSRSIDSTRELDGQQQANICCVSAAHLDRPPNYEDALINSKPINWHYLASKDDINTKNDKLKLSAVTTCHRMRQTVNMSDPSDVNCLHHSRRNKSDPRKQSICSQCSIINNTTELTSYQRVDSKHSNNSVTQKAMNFVRGFASLEPPTGLHQPTGQRRSSTSTNNRRQMQSNSQRKVSFCQLDVSQLTESSPPKYSELTFEYELSYHQPRDESSH